MPSSSRRSASPSASAAAFCVVDDLPASRRSLARKLGLARFDTVSVGSVEEALEQLAKDPGFDLVLADEFMPDERRPGSLDGIAHRSALRNPALHPDCRCSAPSTIPSSWQHLPDAVGLKPMRASALTTLVDQVLTGQSAAYKAWMRPRA